MFEHLLIVEFLKRLEETANSASKPKFDLTSYFSAGNVISADFYQIAKKSDEGTVDVIQSILSTLPYLIEPLCIPMTVVICNSIIRFMTGLPQSAPADIILAIAVFNLAVLADPDKFTGYMTYQLFQDQVRPIFELLALIGFFSWTLAVFFVETRLEEFRDSRRVGSNGAEERLRTGKRQPIPFLPYFLSLLLPAFAIIIDLIPFTYDGG